MRRRVVALVERFGYQLQLHPASWRVRMMQHRDVGLVLDVGAATGHYGLELRRAGYRGRIISFEPLAAPFATLSRRVAGDAEWEARKVGLADAAGEATINVAGNSDSSSMLAMLPRHHEAAAEAAYVGIETIRLTTLDDVVAAEAVEPARIFVKIDVQGFERQVLEGGAATLAALRGLQLEMSLVPLYDGAMLYDETLELMRRHGFALCGLEPGFMDVRTGDLLQADGIFFRA